jgi:hypothetical protein
MTRAPLENWQAAEHSGKFRSEASKRPPKEKSLQFILNHFFVQIIVSPQRYRPEQPVRDECCEGIEPGFEENVTMGAKLHPTARTTDGGCPRQSEPAPLDFKEKLIPGRNHHAGMRRPFASGPARRQ